MTHTKTAGRPRQNGDDKALYEHELYLMLKETLPLKYRFYDGRINTNQLSKDSKLSRWTIYRWFKGENMSAGSAKRLVKISNEAECERKGALTLEKLTKFILGN